MLGDVDVNSHIPCREKESKFVQVWLGFLEGDQVHSHASGFPDQVWVSPPFFS